MKPFVFLLLPLCLSAQLAVACLNDSEKTAHPIVIQNAATHLKEALAVDPKVKGERAVTQTSRESIFLHKNQYAIALIYQGQLQKAVGILEKMEKETPGSYYVAANLGTAFELSGENEKALHWIKEGIRRNPNSHLGTEWLHVKILEAKIAHAQDPRYFHKQSVLNLKFDQRGTFQNVSVGSESISVEKVKTALAYQLSERLQFVKKADPTVASLLYDYAALEAVGNAFESARDLMKMALDFGYPAVQGEEVLKNYNRQLASAPAKKNMVPLGKK